METNEDESIDTPKVYLLHRALKLVINKIHEILSWEKYSSLFSKEFLEEHKNLIYSSYNSSIVDILSKNIEVTF